MRWDQICLRIMLWSLGMTAAVGVMAIFTSGHDVIVRLLGTTALTATAAGLLWPMTRLADQPTTRAAGFVGMGAIILEFALILTLIWANMFRHDGYYYFEERVGLLALAVFLAAPPAVIFLVFLHHPTSWLAARVGTSASILAFAEMLGAVFHFRQRDFSSEDMWWAAAGITGLFGFLGVCSLVGSLPERPWRWIGVIGSFLAWLTCSLHIFRPTHSDPGQILFTLVTTLSAASAYANLVLLPRLTPLFEIFRRVTIGLALLTAVLIDLLVVGDILNWTNAMDPLGRLAAATGVVAACGTVAVLILALISRPSRRRGAEVKETTMVPWTEITLTCPRCSLPQAIALGESRCGQCRLGFYVEVHLKT